MLCRVLLQLQRLSSSHFSIPSTSQRAASCSPRQISDLIGSDAVRLEVALSVALAEAAKAHDQVAGGHTRGKVVLTV